MRLFILAIVAGIGVLVGVALYVGQEIVNPGTPDTKITARLAEEHEAVEATEIGAEKAAEVISDSDANIDKYKSQLRTAQLPAGTTSYDTAAFRKQLPDIFQFPDQPVPAPPPITVATVMTPGKVVTLPAPAIGSNGGTSIVPNAPSAASDNTDVRPDTPMIKQLTAPEHKPSVATDTNPNVQVEVAPASEGRAARSRMIVSR